MRVAGFEPVFAIADEDIERENAEKTAAVHFLRFEFTAPMIAALKTGAALSVGIDHPHYQAAVDPLADTVRTALCEDFQSNL
jgi:Protein of unknown function (DUF3501).